MRFLFFRLIFLLFILCSCTQVSLNMSVDRVDIAFSENYEHEFEFNYYGKLDFYLWGNYPEKGRSVNVEEHFLQRGIREVSDFHFTTYLSFYDYLYYFMSFGMYTPLSYHIYARFSDEGEFTEREF